MAAKEMWKLGETIDLDRIMWFFVAVVVFRSGVFSFICSSIKENERFRKSKRWEMKAYRIWLTKPWNMNIQTPKLRNVSEFSL